MSCANTSKKKKPRLELAIYARHGQPDAYHYALFVSPKYKAPQVRQTITKHDVKNALQNPFADHVDTQRPWRYDRDVIEHVGDEPGLLARVIVGKILVPVEEVEATLVATPVKDNGIGDFDDEMWVQAAVEELGKAGAVKGLVRWGAMKGVAVSYVEMKKRIGRWEPGWRDGKIPMLDLMTGEEIVG